MRLGANKLLAIILLVFVAGCANQKVNKQTAVSNTMEKIELITKDNIKIIGNYDKRSENAVILLHMLDRSKEDWKDFSDILLKNNYTVLAIDLRGHGESSLNWKTFNEEDFNNMVFDINAAYNFLKSNNITSIQIIGASIGANLALNYAETNQEIKSIVLLSPGRDYRGINTEKAIQKYQRPLFIVASNNDLYSKQSSDYLYSNSPSKNKKMQIYQSAGHGTRMFGKEKPDLTNILVEWLAKYQ